MNRNWGLAVGLIASSLYCGAGHAEIGKASAAPGDWFMGFNLGGAATWGADRQVARVDSPARDLDYDDGVIATGGLEIGYVMEGEASPFDRVELNVDVFAVFRDVDDRTDFAAVLNADGNSNTSSTFSSDPGGIEVTGEDSQFDIEARLSFKSTLMDDGERVVIGSIEPFFRYQDTDGETKMRFDPPVISVTSGREDSIEAYYVGLQVAAEFEQPVAESLNLVGRASAGAYYVDSDIEDQVILNGEDFGGVAEDSGSTFGGRFGAALGFKVPLYAEGVTFTILGTVDYYTDVATIDHVDDDGPDSRTEADFDDRLDVGGRVGLIIPMK